MEESIFFCSQQFQLFLDLSTYNKAWPVHSHNEYTLSSIKHCVTNCVTVDFWIDFCEVNYTLMVTPTMQQQLVNEERVELFFLFSMMQIIYWNLN